MKTNWHPLLTLLLIKTVRQLNAVYGNLICNEGLLQRSSFFTFHPHREEGIVVTQKFQIGCIDMRYFILKVLVRYEILFNIKYW